MKPLLILTLLLLPSITFSQEIAIDSKGKDVFLHYKADEYDFSFSTGDPALKINYNLPIPGLLHYYYINQDTSQKTIAKSSVINFSVKVATGDDLFFVQKINKLKPKISFGIGFQRTIDKFYDINLLPEWAYSSGFNLYINVDNLTVFDTTSLTSNSKMPTSFGIKGNLSLYRKRTFALSLIGELEKGWNTNSLKKYQKNEPKFSNPQVIVLDDFIGRIGTLDKRNNYRFALSTPLFPFKTGFITSRLNVTPYAITFGSFDSSPRYIIGLMANLLGNGISGRNYKLKKGIGIGVDWEYDNGWESATIFLSGTLNIGNLAEERRTRKAQ